MTLVFLVDKQFDCEGTISDMFRSLWTQWDSFSRLNSLDESQLRSWPTQPKAYLAAMLSDSCFPLPKEEGSERCPKLGTHLSENSGFRPRPLGNHLARYWKSTSMSWTLNRDIQLHEQATRFGSYSLPIPQAMSPRAWSTRISASTILCLGRRTWDSVDRDWRVRKGYQEELIPSTLSWLIYSDSCILEIHAKL